MTQPTTDVIDDLLAARAVCPEDGIVNVALARAYSEILYIRKSLDSIVAVCRDARTDDHWEGLAEAKEPNEEQGR
jgi:hypothetical protein